MTHYLQIYNRDRVFAPFVFRNCDTFLFQNLENQETVTEGDVEEEEETEKKEDEDQDVEDDEVYDDDDMEDVGGFLLAMIPLEFGFSLRS